MAHWTLNSYSTYQWICVSLEQHLWCFCASRQPSPNQEVLHCKHLELYSALSAFTQVSNMPDVFYLGHSYVSSLADHLQNFCPSTLGPDTAASLMGISNHFSHLHLHGQSGAAILKPDSFTVPYAALHFHRPQVVLLEFGSNDLACGAEPLPVASAIVALAKELVSLGVRRTIIFGPLIRTANLSVTLDIMTANSRRCNTILYHLCDVEKQLEFRTHNGFWDVPVHQWSRDGIHPNTQEGRRKHKRSIRFAALEALGHV